MTPKPVRLVVRLPRELAEKVAVWASLLNVSHTKMIGLAMTRWTQQSSLEFEALGLPPLDDHASHKPHD